MTMGGLGVVLAMLGVVACPISSGDTAFRSARLTLADWFRLDQKSWKNRLLLTIPLLGLGAVISQLDYTSIWEYFASTNQILAMIVLWTASMYLIKNGQKPYITIVPAVFMSMVTMTFVFESDLYLGRVKPLASVSIALGIVFAFAFLMLFLYKARKQQLS